MTDLNTSTTEDRQIENFDRGFKPKSDSDKRRQMAEGRWQKFTCSEEVFTKSEEAPSFHGGVSLTSTEPGFSLKGEVLDQRDKLEADPSALCPLPSAFQGGSLGNIIFFTSNFWL